MYRPVLLISLALLVASCKRTEATAVPGTKPETRNKARPVADPGPEHRGPCDPLIATHRSIELSTPLVVGRARDGKVYVVDRIGAIDSRSFIGANEVLERTGGGGAFESRTEVVWENYDARDRVLLVRLDRQARQQGVLNPQHSELTLIDRSRDRADPEKLAASGERLENLPPSAVSGWKVVDRTGWIEAEYFAQTDDGRWLLVTMPRPITGNYDHTRVFFGFPGAVVERRLLYFGRGRDGGSTTLRFALEDGVNAEVSFPIRCATDAGEHVVGARLCAGTLKVSERATALRHIEPETETLASLQFVCGA